MNHLELEFKGMPKCMQGFLVILWGRDERIFSCQRGQLQQEKHEFQFQGLSSFSPCCSVCFMTCLTDGNSRRTQNETISLL